MAIDWQIEHTTSFNCNFSNFSALFSNLNSRFLSLADIFDKQMTTGLLKVAALILLFLYDISVKF